MARGWYVFRGVDCHHVCYMDRQGAEVGSPGRLFFPSRQEAEQAARRFGWLNYEITWSLIP
jgi:hypothetical protein